MGGLLSRVCLVFFVMLIGLAIALSFDAKWDQGLGEKIVFAMWLSVAVPMTIGVVCGELPKGNDWVLVRLGVATFCRTGLPLLIVIFVDSMSEGKLAEAAYGYLAFFYLFGFFVSVWVSVSRLRLTNSMDGVDRAVI